MKMTATTTMLSHEDALASRRWYLIDAKDQVLGRVASQAAQLLRGKTNPKFAPHIDCGHFVVIVNASEIRVTGRKSEQKLYYRHSGYPGGIRSRTAGEMKSKHPDRMIRIAVEGMLPKNRLGRHLATKLKVYAGGEHPHVAQQPIAIEVA